MGDCVCREKGFGFGFSYKKGFCFLCVLCVLCVLCGASFFGGLSLALGLTSHFSPLTSHVLNISLPPLFSGFPVYRLPSPSWGPGAPSEAKG